MKKNFVSNSRESIRMFKNPLFEALSKVPFYVPLIVYIPVIAYFFWASVTANGFLVFLLHLFLGLLIWTLTEYVLHRFVFHFYPSSEWGKRIHFIFHGVHHDYPNDAQRLVMPPSASIPLATAFYFLFRWLLPVEMLDGFFGGFISGYLFYDMTHYMLHHAQFKNGIWKKIKQHHMLHHYDDSTKGYGVTSDLWDRIFRSGFLKK
ncbi:sterol desaturase/sphingolipid hydroxylase (fatty acid hydroxylase superfamily) [Pedobacter africanus]|uniref:Sterol desaturase/sphingolipid hydroxylase (Fatty acid hydroxylase superfamily) n=1 Tax=Pedobacter africanus TaxID=151894 RepID=A0ACC6KU25_9SPHI|nr:sterol desaturase family protein [Pedobacter africanus]MDR6782633.1 sterol desaturase/sphingolipid hydroxylase (fatty acid hydroxylase superfamily) [Pedobacter africanus]